MIHSQIPFLTAILTGGLSKKLVDGVNLSQADWTVLMPYLEKNGLVAIASDAFGLYRKNDLPLPPPAILQQAQDTAVSLERSNLLDTMIMHKLCHQWGEEGRKMIALGGSAFSLVYPIPSHNGSAALDYFPLYSSADKSKVKPVDEVPQLPFKHIKLHPVDSAVGNLKGSRANKHSAVLQEVFSASPCIAVPKPGYAIPNLQFCALYMLHTNQLSLIEDRLTIRIVCDWAMLLSALSREGVNFDWSDFWHQAERLGLTNFGATLSALALQLTGVQLPAEAAPATAQADDAEVLLSLILDPVEGDEPESGRGNRFLNVFRHREVYTRYTNINVTGEAFRQLFS